MPCVRVRGINILNPVDQRTACISRTTSEPDHLTLAAAVMRLDSVVCGLGKNGCMARDLALEADHIRDQTSPSCPSICGDSQTVTVAANQCQLSALEQTLAELSWSDKALVETICGQKSSLASYDPSTSIELGQEHATGGREKHQLNTLLGQFTRPRLNTRVGRDSMLLNFCRGVLGQNRALTRARRRVPLRSGNLVQHFGHRTRATLNISVSASPGTAKAQLGNTAVSMKLVGMRQCAQLCCPDRLTNSLGSEISYDHPCLSQQGQVKTARWRLSRTARWRLSRTARWRLSRTARWRLSRTARWRLSRTARWRLSRTARWRLSRTARYGKAKSRRKHYKTATLWNGKHRRMNPCVGCVEQIGRDETTVIQKLAKESQGLAVSSIHGIHPKVDACDRQRMCTTQPGPVISSGKINLPLWQHPSNDLTTSHNSPEDRTFICQNMRDRRYGSETVKSTPVAGVGQVFDWSLPTGSSEMTSYCFLNVNSNAGISESGTDNVKAETKQPSCTSVLSVLSSDQFYSTHTDTPDGKINDSDIEVSPSFSSIEDGPDKGNFSDPDLAASRDVGQAKQSPTTEPEKRKKAASLSSSETIKPKRQRNADNGQGDDNPETRGVKHTTSGQGLHCPTSDEVPKYKRKKKTMETLYIKFESSMSKKVTTTTVLKDGRKASVNTKPRLESQRQALAPEDIQRETNSGQEKLDNKNLAENPRFTKIVRCNEGRPESPLKSNLESLKEAAPQPRALVSPDAWCEFDSHCQSMRSIPGHGQKHDSYSPNKHNVSLPERLSHHQPSYKPHTSPCSLEQRQDVPDSDYASEKESSAATIVDVHKLTPFKEAAMLAEVHEHSCRSDIINRSKFEFHRKDVNIYSDKKQTFKQNSLAQREYQVSQIDNREEQHSRPDSVSATKNQSPAYDHSSKVETIVRRKNLVKSKDISPLKKSPVEPAKPEVKRAPSSKVRSKTTDDTAGKDESNETGKGKHPVQPAASVKKKSPVRAKMPSRSPEVKRKRQCSKKTVERKSKNSKYSKDKDSVKADKSRTHKVSEKQADKRNKKKNPKRKWHEKSESETTESVPQMKRRIPAMRSRSHETSKTTQTVSCSSSAPHFLEVTLLSEQLSPMNHWRAKKSMSATDEDKQHGYAEINSIDKDGVIRSREVNLKGRGTSSVENVSICTLADAGVRSAESLPPFTGTVYTTLTKVVHMTSCPKLKRSEKDLQRAELGWNSSMLTAEEKAAIERSKQQQKRAKVKARYFLAKSKLKRNMIEAAGAKLKPRRCHDDGDTNIRDCSERDDTSQQDKMKLGQGKSVQFSDSTEDHEASKDDTAADKVTSQQMADNIFGHQSANKTLSDVLKVLNKLEADASGKLSKKDEARPQTTPPRKKRPVWLKRQPKETPTAVAKACAAAKQLSTVVATNQGQPLDSIAKQSQRMMNFNLCYPLKQTMDSSTLGNYDLDDKRAVAYNSWINSALMAPMNKATRRLVAKTGSPVDIKEIIEGSSVDAADYYRAIRSMQEMGVRAAKSVPSLGVQRTAGTEIFENRQMKPLGKSRLPGQRKSKDPNLLDSGSHRSLSTAESAAIVGIEDSLSPASSTDIDLASMRPRSGHARLSGSDQFRKMKKPTKKDFADISSKWHVVSAQDVCSVPDLTNVQYYGDTAEFTVLNLGLTWMVQSFFNRLPFLNGKQPAAAANASGDTSNNRHTHE